MPLTDQQPAGNEHGADRSHDPWAVSTPAAGTRHEVSAAHGPSAHATQGPFAPPVNSLLRACFGHVVDEISVGRGEGEKNRGIAAKAHTRGTRVSLGDDIREDPADPQSMEVIGHEVAHALAGGGSGRDLLNCKDDPGEHAAYDAGAQFRRFVEGGAKGPAPRLKPAFGGQAAIHRWESGEHVQAVDNAVNILQKEGRPGGGKLAPSTTELLDAPVHLGNGLDLPPGEITALMGDFYGKFDEKGNFDPAASFAQLNDPKNREEMNQLLFEIRKEKETGVEASANTLEWITRNRRGSKGERSYLDLAKKNQSHFSADSMEGTNNNMGAYTAFHQMALKAAQEGDENRARALESCAMHYLTDRHSAGHNVDKKKVMRAAGHEDEGVFANMHAKAVHDDGNRNGITVRNGHQGESAESWTAYGDGHWAAAGNKENRRRTAESVYSSWHELDEVLSKAKTPEQVQKDGYAAYRTVPQWSPERQEGAEGTARNLTRPGLTWQYKKQIPEGAGGWLANTEGSVENVASDAWGWTKDKVGRGWDWTKDKAGKGWDWTKRTAGSAWDRTKEGAHDLWEGAKHKAHDAWDGVKHGASVAWDHTKKGASAAWDATQESARSAWSGAKDVASETWGGIKDTGHAVWDEAKHLGHELHEGAGEVWDGARDGAGQAWDGTKRIAKDAWGGVKHGASGAWEGAKSGWGWLKNKLP